MPQLLRRTQSTPRNAAFARLELGRWTKSLITKCFGGHMPSAPGENRDCEVTAQVFGLKTDGLSLKAFSLQSIFLSSCLRIKSSVQLKAGTAACHVTQAP
jgi:hypothetical protein